MNSDISGLPINRAIYDRVNIVKVPFSDENFRALVVHGIYRIGVGENRGVKMGVLRGHSHVRI